MPTRWIRVNWGVFIKLYYTNKYHTFWPLDNIGPAFLPWLRAVGDLYCTSAKQLTAPHKDTVYNLIDAICIRKFLQRGSRTSWQITRLQHLSILLLLSESTCLESDRRLSIIILFKENIFPMYICRGQSLINFVYDLNAISLKKGLIPTTFRLLSFLVLENLIFKCKPDARGIQKYSAHLLARS